jgi:hypothetical protein
VGLSGRVGRCYRVERVAAAEVHVLEPMLDLVGHFWHMSGENGLSAYEKIVLSNYIVYKASSAIPYVRSIYL